jgi:hypothetical protein
VLRFLRDGDAVTSAATISSDAGKGAAAAK